MTIRIFDNRIDFGNYSLIATAKGISVNVSNSNTTAAFVSSFDFTNSPFQGTNSGYTSGGFSSPTIFNTIDKFRFAINNNSLDVGDLTQARYLAAGQSSSVSGYTSGGYAPPATPVNIIDKFGFAQNSNATDVGDLNAVRFGSAGQSSNTSGYTSGGFGAPPFTSVNTVYKFPFAIDLNSSSVGTLTQSRTYFSSQSSSTHGYSSGGRTTTSSPTNVNTIDKFPFASDGTATDVGDLTSVLALTGSASSTAHGYTMGGGQVAAIVATVDRFSFITNQNSTSVSSLTFGRYGSSGHSSETNGFVTGGFTAPPQTAQNTIERFPFDVGVIISSFAFDVGDLTVSRGYTAGTQD